MAYDGAIVLEKATMGNPDMEWDLSGRGSTNMESFATGISVHLGQTIKFKVNPNSNNHLINIYRLGYHGGLGGRDKTGVERNRCRKVSTRAALSDGLPRSVGASEPASGGDTSWPALAPCPRFVLLSYRPKCS